MILRRSQVTAGTTTKVIKASARFLKEFTATLLTSKLDLSSTIFFVTTQTLVLGFRCDHYPSSLTFQQAQHHCSIPVTYGRI
jgi:hypothetical protein